MRLLIFTVLVSYAAIIDRTAVIAGSRVILDSDIMRDIRVTAFLNGEAPDLSIASRKQAANRLIDQELMRQEIQGGDYPIAPEDETATLLAQIKRDRFGGDDARYKEALQHAGITESELKQRLSWQITVLRFIDARFRPAVVVSDEEVQSYYTAHRTEFKGNLDDEREKVVDQITGGQVNTLLDSWLAQTRKDTRIEYLEKSLQ